MSHDDHKGTDKHQAKDGKKAVERRFIPEPTARSNWIALFGGLGAAMLGAGVYGQWIHDVPLESAPIVLAVGAAGLALAGVMGDPGAAPIRVGGGGVAVERGTQPDRIAWWEIERVALEPAGVVVEASPGRKIAAGLAHHAAAAAWIVKEALDRIPKRVTIDPERRPALLRDTHEEGVLVEGEPAQTAGRRCKASGTLISFERDAKVCGRCAQVYHREHVPKACLTCEAELA